MRPALLAAQAHRPQWTRIGLRRLRRLRRRIADRRCKRFVGIDRVGARRWKRIGFARIGRRSGRLDRLGPVSALRQRRLGSGNVSRHVGVLVLRFVETQQRLCRFAMRARSSGESGLACRVSVLIQTYRSESPGEPAPLNTTGANPQRSTPIAASNQAFAPPSARDSSAASPSSRASLPYSTRRLYSVFRLMPRISAARVFTPPHCSSVARIS